jgi:ComF family protein
MAHFNFSYQAYHLLWNSIDLLFPPVCGGCGKAGTRWCADCQQQISRIEGEYCQTCGQPLLHGASCQTCELDLPPYRFLRSWALFESPLRDALHRLKYRRDLGLGDALAQQMLEFVQSLNWPVEIMVPIPLSKARLQERGYNQVALIARPLALALGLSYTPSALVRWRNTRSQVGLTRDERRENVRGVFRGMKEKVLGRNVLLMDDVATTGATLASAAEALLSAGAKQVYALTVARASLVERERVRDQHPNRRTYVQQSGSSGT